MVEFKEMKIIYNNIIPFKGFKAINLFGILFVRSEYKVEERTIRHESIHTAQIKELLYIFFYLWYIIEWIIRLFQCSFDFKKAYRNISFEREAYDNEFDIDYLENRERFNFGKYLKI